MAAMPSLVQQAPHFIEGDALRIAAELYGLEATAAPLPSERDQNFHLRDTAGDQYVLRIDRKPIETTSKRNLALIMGKFTAEDVIKTFEKSRSVPELVPVFGGK